MQSVTEHISSKFPISEKEYQNLEKKFGDLIHYEAWQLLKRNTKNNHTHELEDIAQELRMSMLHAGSYYKRQLYIEDCFEVADKCVCDEFSDLVVQELKRLWNNRKRHGANKQKFGPWQEEILDSIVENYIPKEQKPSRNKELKIDSRFARYCKNITWNAQKTMGKKITKEKSWRTGLVSLSEYDFLGGF